MDKTRLRRVIFGVALSLFFFILISFFGESFAQRKEYPSKPIRVISPVAPGGQSDLAARACSEELSKRLGVPVVIVNQEGGGGIIGASEVAKSKPDGYTLMSVPMNTMLISPAINPSLTYKPKDFTPICTVAASPVLCAVNSSSPFNTIDALLDYGKKNPGKLNGGVPGSGTTGHLDQELFKYYADVDIVTVPFKGSPQAITALLGSHVDLYFGAFAPLAGHLKSGRVRGLLATNKLKDFPDIPLFSQKGLAQAGMTTWTGFVGPANLPREVQKTLADAFAEVMKQPGVLKSLENAGFTPYFLGSEAMSKLVNEESEKILTIVKRAHIQQN